MQFLPLILSFPVLSDSSSLGTGLQQLHSHSSIMLYMRPTDYRAEYGKHGSEEVEDEKRMIKKNNLKDPKDR